MTAPSPVVDVIVIGAGLAGVAAALTAAEAGASVCLLEKGSDFGGSSVRAGGALVFAGTEQQAELGMADNKDLLREAILKTGLYKNNPEAVEAYVEHQLDTYLWMRAHGIEFSLPPSGNGEIVRLHSTPKGYLTRELHRQFLLLDNAEYHSAAPVGRLLREPDGRVGGVVASIDGREQTIQARRGVVLASGGIGRSRELLEIFAPEWVNAVPMCGLDNTGDGLRMGWALGAQVADMAYIEASFGASIKNYPDLAVDEPILLYPNSQGALIVNLEAVRFVNEALNYKIISGICERQPKGIAFQIFDDTMMSRSQPQPTPADFKGALADGYVIQADTLTELANRLQLDPTVFQSTVDTYNAYADSGTDPDFGRPMLDYGIDGGARIDSAPFYAFPSRNGMTTTYCGLKVDRSLAIIDVFGQPIAGLFGAGEVVGGFHGAGYLSGTGLGKAGVFGHAAGLSAAAAG